MGEMAGGQKMPKTAHKGLLLDSSFCSLSTAVVELVGKPGGQKGAKTAQSCRPKARYGQRYPCPAYLIIG